MRREPASAKRGTGKPAGPVRQRSPISCARWLGEFVVLPALLALVIIRVRLVAWPYGFDIGDEGYFNVVAWKMLDGWALYKDLQSVYTPGLHLLQAAIFRLSEPNAYYGKAINICTMVPAGVMLYFILRPYIHPLLAFLGACYLPAMANGYYPGHVPVFAALLLIAWPGYDRSRPAQWCAGLLAGLGVLGKHEVGIAGTAGILIATLVLQREGKGWRSLRPALPAAARVVAGAAIPVVAFLAYESARGRWSDIYYFLWVAPRRWSKVLARSRGWLALPTKGGGLPYLFHSARVADFYSPLLFIPVGLAVLAWRAAKAKASRAELALLGPGIMSGLLMLLVLTARDVHHLHSCRLPGLAMEAFLFVWGLRWLANRFRGLSQVHPLAWLGPALVWSALLVIWVARVPDYLIMFTHNVAAGQPGLEPRQAQVLATWQQPQVPHAGPIRLPAVERVMWEETLAYVRAHSRPGASVFAAPGAPALYFFTDRQPPTRFLLFYPGMVDQKHEREILRDLIRANIDLVVFNGKPEADFCGMSFAQQCPQLYRWIMANFRWDRTIHTLEFYLPVGRADAQSALAGSLP